MGWRTHGMYGFDHTRAIEALRVPANHRVEAVYAAGRLGDPALLPIASRAREFPSARVSLKALAYEARSRPLEMRNYAGFGR
jgi:hypothetical protein